MRIGEVLSKTRKLVIVLMSLILVTGITAHYGITQLTDVIWTYSDSSRTVEETGFGDGDTVYVRVTDTTTKGGTKAMTVANNTIGNTISVNVTDSNSDSLYLGSFIVYSGANDDANNKLALFYGQSATITADLASDGTSGTKTISADYTAPPPTDLTATAIAGGSIQLSWTASSPETNVAQYNIYRATTSGDQDFNSPLASVSAGTTTYTDSATSDGVTYYYVVRAQDKSENIETNTNEAIATADATAPPSPTNLAATAIVGNGIQLTWTASSPATDVAQYNIYRSTTSGGQSYTSPTYTVSVGAASYTDTSVTDRVTYYYVVRARDAAGNIETNTSEVSATVMISPPSVTVSQIDIKYEEEVLYDLTSSTDSDNPTVFAKGKIDEIYLQLDLHGGFELSETSSSIILFKDVGEWADEISGTQEIDAGTGWAELIFHLDPVFNPALDRHSRDDTYWVDASAVSTTSSSNDFDFYFVYDTTSPEIPDFGIASFNSSIDTVSVSGTTESNASDPQEVEIFLNGESRGTVTAYATGDFSKDNIGLISGDNFITVQSTDGAGNKSNLSGSLHLEYNPQRLLSLVVRSSRVVLSGSATIPVRVIYSVSEAAEVAILIFNLHGEIVKEWSEWVNPGEEPEWSWSGDNMYGNTVNNGVYILKVDARASGGWYDHEIKLLSVLR